MRLIIATLLLFLFSSAIKRESLCEDVRLYEKAPFPVGAAIHVHKLKQEEKYRNTVLRHFNSFTTENIMKPRFIHPKKDVFYFADTDRLMEYCSYYKIRLHGHTLVWDKALPVWMEKFKGSAEEWDALLKNHVQSVITHCSHYIKSWDVVNEAFNDDGSLKKNIWLKNLGTAYIEKAFRYAYEADSTALLFYNDYSLERKGPKLYAVLGYFEMLREKGVRVNGIGLQMHVRLNYPGISEINEAALLIQQKKFLVHYSEMDISLRGEEYAFMSRKKLFELQKERVRQIAHGYMKLDPKFRFGITFWGVGDNDSWLTEEHFRARPLLFDKHYRIKPAFCGFVEGLSENQKVISHGY